MSYGARHHQLTLADYFAAERMSPQKHEYADGQILLMAGGSPRHNYLATQVAGLLRERLKAGPCFAMGADQRIATADGLYTYADAAVFCGTLEVGEEQTATNPVVLVEVLSDSTRSYDRGDKLDRYRTIPSLQHVMLVEPDAPDVETWTRGPTGWTRIVLVGPEDRVTLSAIGVELSIAELYEGVDRVTAPPPR